MEGSLGSPLHRKAEEDGIIIITKIYEATHVGLVKEERIKEAEQKQDLTQYLACLHVTGWVHL